MHHSTHDTSLVHSIPTPDAAETGPEVVSCMVDRFDVQERHDGTYVLVFIRTSMKYPDGVQESVLPPFELGWPKFRQGQGVVHIMRRWFTGDLVEMYLRKLVEGSQDKANDDSPSGCFSWFS
jgi:hypothetical protein